MFVKHGFENVAERAKLGRFLLEKIAKVDSIERHSYAERLRMAFEQLGPTFVKLGQLLATRPDLIPNEFVDEFKKLHDSVKPVSFQDIEAVLTAEYGDYTRVFKSVNPEPLGSASIAQVHRAVLTDGSEVVIKVQRPGIVHTINEDLGVLYSLAQLLDRYIPEVRVFNPVGIVDEFFKTLELETNFVIEANNILRFQKNFLNDPIVKIPNVYLDLTTPHVLVMEALNGIPLSQFEKLQSQGVDTELIVKRGMRIFFRMVFSDKFFHGDLHAGNLFIMPNDKLGLVDFGVVGRLSDKVRDSIADLFVSLANQDYERLAFQYIDMGPYNEKTDVDQFARDLRDLIAPYFGLSFKNVNTGRVLMDSTSLAAKHGVAVPRDLMLFFKSIVTIEGMGRLIVKDFDVMSQILEISDEIVKAKYDPNKVIKDLVYVAKDSASLMYSLPRQIKQLTRKMNSPAYRWKMQIDELPEIKRSIEASSNILFLGLVIGSLVIGSSIALEYQGGYLFMGLPLVSGIGYLLSGILGLLAFYNYIKKS